MNLTASAASANNLRAWACVEIFGREFTVELDERYFANAAWALDMPVSIDALLAYVEQYGETPYVENVQSMPIRKIWLEYGKPETALWVMPI